MISNLKNISETELDLPIWRYLTFPKFISMVTYRALWFAKLNILRDEYEGTLPIATEIRMRQYNERTKKVFNTPEFHRQIDNWPKDIVSSGRELTVVNCWFFGDNESKDMWAKYAGSNEGVAICSSIRRLQNSVNAFPEVSMSTKTPRCLNMDGSPLTKEQYTGKNMNNFENKGLYITANLSSLIQFIVLAPGATDWFELLVKRILKLFNWECPVKRSRFEPHCPTEPDVNMKSKRGCGSQITILPQRRQVNFEGR